MNKAELVEFIAEKAGLTKAAATSALDAFQEGVINSLRNGDPVVWTNFLTVTSKKRAARIGRNPSTGEKIEIPESNVVGFKAGKALKDAVKL